VPHAVPHPLSISEGFKLLAAGAFHAVTVLGDANCPEAHGWMSVGPVLIYVLYRVCTAHYRRSRIVAVSNSRTQKQFIDARAQERGLSNLEIITCDVNRLEPPRNRQPNRVVWVEMFEHMRNYEVLLARVVSWMKPAATLLVHIFTHEEYAYPFEARAENGWIARYFFTGSIMPSDGLLLYFQRDVRLLAHWPVCGRHAQLTSEAWLRNMDAKRAQLTPILSRTYGADQAVRWWVYWRVFFMACEELCEYRGGREWLVSHYLFEKR
jgi:cyclopropane-fatty-acyl-phospholipid synthase